MPLMKNELRTSVRIGLSCLVMILPFSSVKAWSDDIYLWNGSHIVGAITGVDGRKLVVETEFAGEISISFDAIEGIETEDEKGYKLDTGEILFGQLHFDEGRQSLLRDDTRIDVALDTVVAIGNPDELSGPTVNWFGRANFGAIFESGNTDELDVNAFVRTTRESDVGRLSLLLRGEYGEKNDIKTDNSVLGEAKYEYDLTERLFAFGLSQLEYDEFEDLDLRLSLVGGIGYFFIKSERQTLKGSLGLAYQHEDFADGTSTDNVLAPFGYEYRFDVREWFRFRSDLLFFVNLTMTNDWRFDAESAIEIPISSTEAWKIRIGVRNEYDNEPLAGIKEMDSTVFTSLVYDWE